VLFRSAGALVSAYGLLQFLGLDIFRWGKIPFGNTRIFSTFGNPTYLATFLVAAAPLALIAALRTESARMKRLLILAMGMIFIGLTLTFTRSAWIAAIVQFALIAFVARPAIADRRQAGAIAAVILTACAVTLVAVFSIGAGAQTAQRIASTFNASEGSVGSRVEIYRVAARTARENIISGVGPDRFRYAFAQLRPTKYIIQKMHPQTPDDAHNYFLNMAATIGLPGLGLFVLFFFWALIGGWTANARRGPAGITKQVWLISAVGVLVALMFTPSEAGGTFWLWFGLSVGAPAAVASTKRESISANIICAAIGVFLAVTAFMMLTADSYYLKALKLTASDPDSALVAMRQAVKTFPYADTYHLGNGRLSLEKALYLKDEKLLKEALEAYQQGMMKLPGSYSLGRQMADAYDKGATAFNNPIYYGDMLELLNKTLPLNPKDAQLWRLFANAEYGLGNDYEAQQALLRVKRFSPEGAENN
jgi:O-antigen ligase